MILRQETVKAETLKKRLTRESKAIFIIEETKIDYDKYILENLEELKKLTKNYIKNLLWSKEILSPDSEYFKTYFLDILKQIDSTKNPVERMKLEYVFDYLMKKENLDKINEDIIEFNKYTFSPKLNIHNYLEYSKKNYRELLVNAFFKYQKIKIKLEYSGYFFKLAEWSYETIDTKKEEFYKRVFLVEYIENILIHEGKR